MKKNEGGYPACTMPPRLRCSFLQQNRGGFIVKRKAAFHRPRKKYLFAFSEDKKAVLQGRAFGRTPACPGKIACGRCDFAAFCRVQCGGDSAGWLWFISELLLLL